MTERSSVAVISDRCSRHNMIRDIAVLGSGNMGSGIAQKSATEGFSVQMVDREEKWVQRGHETIERKLNDAIERRIFNPEQTEEIKSRIEGVVGHENISKDTDLVIEAVFEDFELKKEIFSSLDRICGENTILATNTSSLSVNELAQQVERKDRFVGLHWFFHPAQNRLIELIPADTTSKETLDDVEQYCKTMGKVIIRSGDSPGFLVNRIFVPWLGEACRLLEEGLASAAQIDRVATEQFSIGLGPFGLMNLTGPAIAVHASNYLAEQLSTPRFAAPENMTAIAESGSSWEIDEESDCGEETYRLIRERLMGQIFCVSAQTIDEGVGSMEDLNRGALVGLRWGKGPFELANHVGVTEAARMARDYAQLAGLNLPEWFSERTEPFEFNFVNVDVEDGIATVLINRPEAMNALNVEVVRQLGEAIDELNGRQDINTIVLEGAGKAFVAGADVKFFVDKINEDSLSEIESFTKDGHRVFDSIEASPHTTVALTNGITLGGGLELSLTCDYRIGTEKTLLRTPETSIGIFPGIGGTQRIPRICGIEAARFTVLAGNFIDAETANALGLVTHLVDASEVTATVRALSNQGKPENKYPGAPSDQSHPVAQMSRAFFSDENMEALLSGEVPEGFDPEDKNVARQMKSLSRAAPVALGLSSELLDKAMVTDLAAGLQSELVSLDRIFSTKDAREGLSALIEGRRPNYIGA
jgi:enoyl-CoA hydratase/3-hydroxyacyl-CoA dehydrogenase